MPYQFFKQIPEHLWNATSLPVIARAYYKKKDHKTVMSLLERETVKKEYPVLIMLANSAIRIKQYSKALKYLQQIRKYGDTVEINHLLAATYLSMGDSDNAKVYYERARKLKSPAMNTNNRK